MIDRARFFRNGRRSYIFVVFLVSIYIFTWVWFKVLLFYYSFWLRLCRFECLLRLAPPLPLAAMFELWKLNVFFNAKPACCFSTKTGQRLCCHWYRWWIRNSSWWSIFCWEPPAAEGVEGSGVDAAIQWKITTQLQERDCYKDFAWKSFCLAGLMWFIRQHDPCHNHQFIAKQSGMIWVVATLNQWFYHWDKLDLQVT